MNDNFQQPSKAMRSAYLADEDEVLDITDHLTVAGRNEVLHPLL